MATKSVPLDKQAEEVVETLQKIGKTVRDVAQEKLDQVSEKSSEYYEQGLDKVHGIACNCEQFLRKRPLTSVLIAAGIGWFFGRFWKRR